MPDVVLASGYDVMGDRTSLAATIAGTKDFLNNYSYDALAQMTSETQQGQSGGNAVATKGISFGYDAIGDVTSVERYTNITQPPSPATDAADTTLGYSSLGQLTSIVHSHNGTTIEGLGYGYDTLARVDSISSTIDGGTALGYDVNSQLVSANYTGAGAPPNETENYDKNGNRVTTNSGDTIGADNLITSDGTFNYTHDGEGNVTRRTRISTAYASDFEVDYEWDFRNRLTDTLFYDNNHVLTKHVHDVYDVLDQLIEQDVDPTGGGTYSQIVHHVWDGEGIVLDFNGQSQLTERYLNGPNTSATDSVFSDLAEEQLNVNSPTSPGTVTFNLLDNLGSVRDVVDVNGVLQDHIDYDVFGQVVHETNSGIHHLTGFAGGLPDPNTGLVLFGHRWYDAANAVWMSPDPLGFGGGDPNEQRYVGNDPANETDPSGEVPPAIIWGVVVGLGWFFGAPSVANAPSDEVDVEMASTYTARQNTENLKTTAGLITLPVGGYVYGRAAGAVGGGFIRGNLAGGFAGGSAHKFGNDIFSACVDPGSGVSKYDRYAPLDYAANGLVWTGFGVTTDVFFSVGSRIFRMSAKPGPDGKVDLTPEEIGIDQVPEGETIIKVEENPNAVPFESAPLEKPAVGSMSNIQARDWYNARVAEIDAVEQQMRAAGKASKEIFETTTRLRNDAKLCARELMQDQALAKSLPPPKTPEEILEKYGGDYEKAIAASKRTNAEVNKSIEEQRAKGGQ